MKTTGSGIGLKICLGSDLREEKPFMFMQSEYIKMSTLAAGKMFRIGKVKGQITTKKAYEI